MIQTLLLNFLFLLIPVLTFLIFFEKKFPLINKMILVALSGISMILCMTFPIHLNSGYLVDLRYIPFLLISLYGGYRYSFVIYIILNLYRIAIGGDGIIQSLIFSTIFFTLVPLYSKKFLQFSPRLRIFNAAFLIFLEGFIYILWLGFYAPLNREFWFLCINTITTFVIMTVILMVLIEQIISNIKENEAIIQSDRLQVISELSASVAHEIRNPLTVTNGFLQLLCKSEAIPKKERTYIDFSLQELNRAEKIVSDFLVFSKPQSENIIKSDLRHETEYAKNILAPYAHMHQVDIELAFNNSLKGKFDQNQIQQCLINLYKNGIESMKDKGGTLSINVSEKKKNIVIMIKDNGIGMTEEQISRLGKPYYSTKTTGTGLGMLMVYSTIHKLNGRISVKSEIEKGTLFTITIPV